MIPLQNNNIQETLYYDKNVENFKFEPFTIRIYFEWYEGENENMNDAEDSTIGINAAKEEIPLEITATIHFEQSTIQEANSESIL